MADSVNSRIRRIGTDGVISTVAGPQAPASVAGPRDLVLSQDGAQLYFSEPSRDRVRRLTLASGAVAAVAGTGTQGDGGEGGPAVNALLNTPVGLGVGQRRVVADCGFAELQGEAGGREWQHFDDCGERAIGIGGEWGQRDGRLAGRAGGCVWGGGWEHLHFELAEWGDPGGERGRVDRELQQRHV